MCAGYVRRVGARRRDSGSGDFVSRATLNNNVFLLFLFVVFYRFVFVVFPSHYFFVWFFVFDFFYRLAVAIELRFHRLL